MDVPGVDCGPSVLEYLTGTSVAGVSHGHKSMTIDENMTIYWYIRLIIHQLYSASYISWHSTDMALLTVN